MRVIYELALALGQPSPARMLQVMRPSEFGLWCAMFRLDPWGEQRADLRMGILASTLANVNRDSKKRPDPFRADEFMPYLPLPEAQPQRSVLETLRAALGHRVIKKE